MTAIAAKAMFSNTSLLSSLAGQSRVSGEFGLGVDPLGEDAHIIDRKVVSNSEWQRGDCS
jgi:hypothetical protein